MEKEREKERKRCIRNKARSDCVGNKCENGKRKSDIVWRMLERGNEKVSIKKWCKEKMLERESSN